MWKSTHFKEFVFLSLLCPGIFLAGTLCCDRAWGVAVEDQGEGSSGSPPAEGADPTPPADATAREPTEFGLAVLKIKGSLPEASGQSGLFGDLEVTLGKLRDRLEQAKTDKKVSAVLLRIRNPVVGRGKLAEVRGAIHDLRESGKPVYAQLEMARASDYLLASACDQIIMPESGALIIPGVRAEVTFYKQLLDKLDVQADMLQVGDYKGAAEPLTRDHMSQAFRTQYESLLDDLYQQLTEMIATDRGLEESAAQKLLDRGLFTAKAAQEAGLIDTVTYDDQWQKQLMDGRGEDTELVVMENYGGKTADTDFSGMMGLVKLMEAFTSGDTQKRSSRRQKIAVIYAVGGIMTGKSSLSPFGGQILGADTIVEALREADENEKVAAIVLRVNSPGGSALASDLIWRETRRIDKPIIASMGDVAASGGYYISMGCDRILAEPGTITGSIGVVGGKLALGKMLERIGVTTEVLSRGENSGIMSPSQPFTDSEREVWTVFMTEIYEQFTTKAAAGRKMDLDTLLQVAGGRIWTGRQALEKGLVDQLGTLRDAVAASRQAAGIDEEEKVDLLILPEPKSFFEQIFEDQSIISPITRIVPQLQRIGGDLYLFGEMMGQSPAVLALPYRLEIR